MSDKLRNLPSVNELLLEAEAAGLLDTAPRAVVVDSIRAALDAARTRAGDPPTAGWLAEVQREINVRTRLSLTRVINATGVVLHTNLGRAPMAEAARKAILDGFGYSTLELDTRTGHRGSRQTHLKRLLTEVTGAEDAIVLNNAASAMFMLLNTLAQDGETVVSRGELVEIGGSFRIPDILTESGTTLVEVGTTNRTRLSDYRLALNPNTRVLLKVHQSNFQQLGFVEDTALGDLVALGDPHGIPVIHDAGSGLLLDLSEYGLSGEPLVSASVATGAVVVFSGDKLVGGPQAGIVVGPKALIAKAAANPLARALRPDKLTIAALEATLLLHRDPKVAVGQIPCLAMLTADQRDLQARARRLAELIPESTTEPGRSAVGGGAFPGAELATRLVAVAATSTDAFLAALRNNAPPVIARASEGRVLLDVRTITDREIPAVAEAVAAARHCVSRDL
ncbi:MAG: L-seryl-tRNA(Sec) selenium transferase [Gemmatimonadales bacterium]